MGWSVDHTLCAHVGYWQLARAVSCAVKELHVLKLTFLTSLKTDLVYICIYHRYKYINHKMGLLKGHAFRNSEVKVYSFIYKTIYSSFVISLSVFRKKICCRNSTTCTIQGYFNVYMYT